MSTSETIAEFIRHRYATGQLKQQSLADFAGMKQATVSKVVKRKQTFPMAHLDETAKFFSFDDPVDFILAAREEVKRVGRWHDSPPITEDEAARLRILDAGARSVRDEDDDEEE